MSKALLTHGEATIFRQEVMKCHAAGTLSVTGAAPGDEDALRVIREQEKAHAVIHGYAETCFTLKINDFRH